LLLHLTDQKTRRQGLEKHFPLLYQLSYPGHFRAGGRIRTGDLRITCSYSGIRRETGMATRFGENSQPALRPAGRNSNPLVANVFPPAFAIQIIQEAT